MRAFLLLAILIFVNISACAADSTEIHGKQTIEWDVKDEELDYQTCGCADSCWTAKLWDKSKTNKRPKLKARLRCDCESLWLKLLNEKEKKLSYDCKEFENKDKLKNIAKKLKEVAN